MKGAPGYCGKDASTSENTDQFEKEMARPTAWGGWGFCDPLCSSAEIRGYAQYTDRPHLKEIMRKVSPHLDCRRYLGVHKGRITVSLPGTRD